MHVVGCEFMSITLIKPLSYQLVKTLFNIFINFNFLCIFYHLYQLYNIY